MSSDEDGTWIETEEVDAAMEVERGVMKRWVFIPRRAPNAPPAPEGSSLTRPWPALSDKVCDNCMHLFDSVPWMRPVRHLVDDVYEMDHNFCSVGCTARFIHDSGDGDSSEQLAWLALLALKVMKLEGGILPMPPSRYVLNIFKGGYMSIEVYREQGGYIPKELGCLDPASDVLVGRPFIPTQYGVIVAQTDRNPVPPPESRVRVMPNVIPSTAPPSPLPSGVEEHKTGDFYDEAAEGGEALPTLSRAMYPETLPETQGGANIMQPLESSLLSRLSLDHGPASPETRRELKAHRPPSPTGLPPSSPTGLPPPPPPLPPLSPPLPSPNTAEGARGADPPPPEEERRQQPPQATATTAPPPLPPPPPRPIRKALKGRRRVQKKAQNLPPPATTRRRTKTPAVDPLAAFCVRT